MDRLLDEVSRLAHLDTSINKDSVGIQGSAVFPLPCSLLASNTMGFGNVPITVCVQRLDQRLILRHGFVKPPVDSLLAPANPENAQLGVNIVQGADISWDSVYDSNQRGFRGVPPAMNDSMLDLDGLSRVAGKAVFARFGGGQLQTVFTQKRLFICSIRVTPWYFRASGRVASS